jgi:hypothetical protein
MIMNMNMILMFLSIVLVSGLPSLELELTTSVITHSATGFEYFRVGDHAFLAVANFWDGKSPDMEADSHVYSISESSKPGFQSVVFSRRHKGAHGVDSFQTLGGESFLVIPGYYDCGGNLEEVQHTDKLACLSTHVYSVESGGGDTVKFTDFLSLKTAGPSQVDHFHWRGVTWMVVAENFADTVKIYRFRTPQESGLPYGQFLPVQTLLCAGAAAVATATLADDRVILVCASYYYDGWDDAWDTDSPVYVVDPADWPEDGMSLEDALLPIFHQKPIQYIPGHGVHDADIFVTGTGDVFLFMSEDRNASSSRIESHLYRLDIPGVPQEGGQEIDLAEVDLPDGASTTRHAEHEHPERKCAPLFTLVDSIPTDGAHGAELFRFAGRLWLAVANFGDRHADRVDADSTLWVFDEETQRLVRSARVQTRGATDWEFFRHAGEAYLVVSNEGADRSTGEVSNLYTVRVKKE